MKTELEIAKYDFESLFGEKIGSEVVEKTERLVRAIVADHLEKYAEASPD